jgi:glycosyltransferase involved in cell wall biosynthesis
MPKISVILTSYNHDKFISEAIDSVLQQTFQDFELIIWDDASSDHSWYLINQYTDPRIKAFRNDLNKGPVFGINKAISEIATGEYIAMHHSDDVWELDKLQKQIDFLAVHPEIGAVFSDALAINEQSEPLSDKQHFYADVFKQSKRSRYEWLYFFFNTGNALCHPSLLIRKQCYADCGLYNPSLAQVPDFDMWIRLCLKYEIHVLPDALVKFRVLDREANTSGNRPETRIRGLYEYYKVLANFQAIQSLDELVKIFPKAQKYYRKEVKNAGFALAMVALEEKPFPFTELFGLEVLSKALADPVQVVEIKQFYNFDYQNLIAISAQHDVFSREEVANLGRDIATLNERIAEREIAIATLNGVVAQREETVVLLNQVVAKRELDICSLKQAIEHLQQVIAERDEHLQQVTTEYAAYIQQIVAQQEQQFNEVVANYEHTLKTLRSSGSWKITAPLRFAGHIARGNFGVAYQVLRNVIANISTKPLLAFKMRVRQRCVDAMVVPEIMQDAAINAIVRQRCLATQRPLIADSLSVLTPSKLPRIDITVVTYNSSRWINAFIDSVLQLSYPKELLSLYFVDNSSTDSTLSDLQAIMPHLTAQGCHAETLKRPNHGYGAGHNAALRLGNAPFCLVTNIDLTFETDTLARLVAVAENDDDKVAAWEARQKPYEHPKYYDPVTGITNWNSHACVLLRRSALQQVGFYDDTLFMYGEDVELSYRLRQAGFLLRYCPQAVVWHYTYEDINQVKPLQYTGSTFANLYLRLKFGSKADALIVPWLGLSLLLPKTEIFKGSRLAVKKNLLRLLFVAPKALLARKPSQIQFPFRAWDYEMIREGAFVELKKLPDSPPLVSIITRTYCGRELYLRQALLSALHQTYPNIECIVVEDGGDTMRAVVDNINEVTGSNIRFLPQPKCGRSATGNAGLAAATGHWCVFLDDDDLLFPDHVEVLANALFNQPDLVAAYSPAWEILTDTARLPNGEYVEVRHQTPPALHQEFDFEILKHHNCMAIQSVLFERRLFEQRGGFEEDMDALEDWLLWLKYAINNRFVHVPKVTSMYRTPANPTINTQRQAILDDAYALAQERLVNYLETFQRAS